MGAYIRKKFIEEIEFLSKSYDSSNEEIYIQTTYISRTIDSAVSQMQGLFDQPMTFPESDATYTLNAIDKELDLLLHVKNNCPRFKEIQRIAGQDPQVI